MDKKIITMGDFLKNAGIVGLRYLLEESDAIEGNDYGITEDKQGIWLCKEYIQKADWTDLYFQAFIIRYGAMTNYQAALDKIEHILEESEQENWEISNCKDDLKFLNEKLLSNSFQSGFESVKDETEHPEVYELLKKNKLNVKMETDELRLRLQELLEFLEQPLCEKTFSMKCILYNYINRFWDGRSILLRANAKKKMKEVFDADFSKPFQTYALSDHAKAKLSCIDCGARFQTKEKVSIAFMKDQADDLSRKRSAFWNCKEDAYLCPTCAFVYALVPLGFLMIGNTFVFVNQNRNILELLRANAAYGKLAYTSLQKEEERYASWIARTIDLMLQEKTKELGNIQIITRGRDDADRYTFDILSKDVLGLLNDEIIARDLSSMARHPYIKVAANYWNIHEEVIMNLIRLKSQYSVLYRLMKLAIEKDDMVPKAALVYNIQIRIIFLIKKSRKQNTGGGYMNRYQVREKGFELRTELLRAKQTEKDDCIRGTVYQLLNALSVGNVERFMEIIMRVYCSTKLQVPDAFIEFLRDKETFTEYGYAFLLGLKGSHYVKKEEVTNE